jgi:hypothetical protein
MTPQAPIIHDIQTARRIHTEMVRTNRLRDALRRPDWLSVFTAHNYPDPSLLERNLEHLGVTGYTVINRPVETWSNSLRIRWFLDYLKQDCRTPLVLYCDADDVIIQDRFERMIEVFEGYACDMLFCSTRWSNGYRCMPEVKAWTEKTHPGRYLNGGVFLGRPDFAIEVYERVLEYVTDEDTASNPDSHAFYRDEKRYGDDFPRGVGCDQTILRFLEPEFYPRLKVDADNRFAWRNDNRTVLEKAMRSVKRSIPAAIKEPIKRILNDG